MKTFVHGVFEKRQNTIVFFVVLIILSFITFWQVLFFGMWVDDSYLIWGSLFHLPSTFWYYNHPGLPLEFLFLSHIFGTHYPFWQIINIVIRAFDSLVISYFLYTLTNSKKSGLVAGVFFSASYVGLEVVDAPIMNIAAIVAIPMLLSLTFFIKFLQKKEKTIKKTLLFLVIALFLDPGRMTVIFLIFPLLFILFTKKSVFSFISTKKVKLLLLPIALFFLLFVVWFVVFEPNAQITQGIVGLIYQPFVYIHKLNRIGNLFAAVGNIFTSPIYSMHKDYQDTGEYTRIFGISGIIVFLLSVGSWYRYFKTKSKFFGIVGFLLLWTVILYVPNWFSEPRAPMSEAHRYVFLSSIGFVSLLAYLTSFVKQKYIFIFFVFALVMGNILKTHSILSEQDTYRSQNTIESLWNSVDKKVPAQQTRNLFLFTGQQPWLSQSIGLFGESRWMLRRHIVNTSDASIIATDIKQATVLFCTRSIILSHVYAWDVGQARLRDNTEKIRSILHKVTCKK